MADISEAELQEQKDAIQLFNDANNGKVNIHDLRKLLRSFGEKYKFALLWGEAQKKNSL